jgi:hypothetical protein
MVMATGEVQTEYDRMMAYIDEMKGIYQRAIEKHQAQSDGLNPREIAAAREHIRSLEALEKTLREHHEMTTGRDYGQGRSRPLRLGLKTVAHLILPDGTRKEIKRG